MTEYVLIPSLVLVGALLLDSLVRPRRSAPYRPWRSLPASWILLLLNLATYGAFFAISGSHVAAALLTLALQLLLVLASNAKQAMLGEPLLFSDLALIGAIFRHPQFYFSALKSWQTLSICVVGFALAISLGWLFDPSPTPHIVGAAISISTIALLAISLRLAPFRGLARTPRFDGDVLRLGLRYRTIVEGSKIERAGIAKHSCGVGGQSSEVLKCAGIIASIVDDHYIQSCRISSAPQAFEACPQQLQLVAGGHDNADRRKWSLPFSPDICAIGAARLGAGASVVKYPAQMHRFAAGFRAATDRAGGEGRAPFLRREIVKIALRQTQNCGAGDIIEVAMQLAVPVRLEVRIAASSTRVKKVVIGVKDVSVRAGLCGGRAVYRSGTRSENVSGAQYHDPCLSIVALTKIRPIRRRTIPHRSEDYAFSRKAGSRSLLSCAALQESDDPDTRRICATGLSDFAVPSACKPQPVSPA